MSRIQLPRSFGQIASELVATTPHSNTPGQRKARPDTDPVRKHSFHEDSRQAKPWQRIGDGSRRQWRRYKGALLTTFDRRLLRERLARLATEGGRPPGRDHARLQANDRIVLADLLDRFNHVTGQLYPAQATIAEATGLSRRFVVGALKRLRRLGFVTWVRRTKTKERSAGEAGPQLEQTSNAYHFDWRGTMAAETWRTFWNLVQIGLRSLAPAAAPPAIAAAPTYPPLAAGLKRLGSLVDKRE